MTLTVNGEQKTIAPGTTLLQLLQQFNLQPAQVVLELNREILHAGDNADRSLQDGDRLEIIQFVGGG